MRSVRWALLASVIATGCATGAGTGPGTTSRRATTPLGPLSARQVEQTLAARPTLPAAAKVAYFVLDPAVAQEVETMLRRSDRVAALHRIPSVFVTGRRHFDPGEGPHPPVDTELLRRLAASAGADALLVVDYGTKTDYDPNGLAALSVMLLPVLFLPLQDASAESYLEGVLIDTRTGREIGQIHSGRQGEESFVTVYSDAAGSLSQRQRREMFDEAAMSLQAVLDSVPHPLPVSTREEVALPSDTTDPWAQPRHVRIGLMADGGVTLEGQPAESLAAFVGGLRRHAERGPTEATLFVAEPVSHGRVVEILDLVRRVGIRDIDIEVAPAREPLEAETREAERDPKEPALRPDRYGF